MKNEEFCNELMGLPMSGDVTVFVDKKEHIIKEISYSESEDENIPTRINIIAKPAVHYTEGEAPPEEQKTAETKIATVELKISGIEELPNKIFDILGGFARSIEAIVNINEVAVGPASAIKRAKEIALNSLKKVEKELSEALEDINKAPKAGE